jgi:hypothetical protein
MPSSAPVVRPSLRLPSRGRLDDALSLLVHQTFPLQPKRVRVLRLRLGLERGRPVPRRDVVREVGWAPGYVSQLERFARQVAATVEPPRTLHAALRLLGSRVVGVEEASARLHDKGLTSTVVHPAVVFTAARWFGVPPTAVILDAGGGELVVPHPDVQHVTSAMSRLVWESGRAGIVTIRELAERLSTTHSVAAALVEASPHVARQGRYVWLVPDRFPHLVRNGIRRMLALGA